MASIQNAARKSIKERKFSDEVRIKAGRMLTYAHFLSHDLVDRQIARIVVRRNILKASGCLTLPLTLAYFCCYVYAVRLHEDIVNVFFTESTLRNQLDEMFVPVGTADQLWDTLTSQDDGSFMHLFFSHTDLYGNPQAHNVTWKDTEIWGDWGAVNSYNHIQGAVQFLQVRASPDDYGANYSCTTGITCDLCRCNDGFQTVDKKTSRRPQKQWCGGPETDELGVACLDLSLTDPPPSSRRLAMGRPEFRSLFPKTQNQKANDVFQFWIYPSETQHEILERLNYFRNRGWIDEDTFTIRIRMYLMNAALGRNRVEQLTATFHFAEAGSVYYERDLQALFLRFHQNKLSLFVDLCFVVSLVLTTVYRLWCAWKAFLVLQLYVHLMSLHSALEIIITLSGWYIVFLFYEMGFVWEKNLVSKLQVVHRHGWSFGRDRLDEVIELFDAGAEAASGIAFMRVFFAQYSVLLMFRLFMSFGSQPRLAIVLRTMQNVLTDFVHFLIVFLPTLMAFVISGSLIFGRRIEAFTTIQGSFGTCFRIAMESEYKWEEMSAESYGAAAMWAWSFLLLVVLLFLNMVLAIVLDIYNETRSNSFPGEPLWETMAVLLARSYNYGSWVPDTSLANTFEKLPDGKVVSCELLEREHPKMPLKQKEIFLKMSGREMEWEIQRFLKTHSLLNLTGSIMETVETSHKTVTRIQTDESHDPITPWVTPTYPSSSGSHAAAQNLGGGSAGNSFVVSNAVTKGGKQPKFDPGGSKVVDSFSEDGPEWLKETWRLLRNQRQYIDYINWKLQLMQWQLQQVMESRPIPGEDGQADATGAGGIPIV